MIADIPKESIAYVDEMGIDTFIHREYCRAKRGKKVIGRVSGKKYKRVGIVEAKLSAKIIAPLQYDGTMDSVFCSSNCNPPPLNVKCTLHKEM